MPEQEQQPTLDDIERLATALHVVFSDQGESFALDGAGVLEIHGTYQNSLPGRAAAYGVLVRLQEDLKRLGPQEPTMRLCRFCGQYHYVKAGEWFCPLQPR